MREQGGRKEEADSHKLEERDAGSWYHNLQVGNAFTPPQAAHTQVVQHGETWTARLVPAQHALLLLLQYLGGEPAEVLLLLLLMCLRMLLMLLELQLLLLQLLLL